jgi:D-ribose pyranase
MRRGGIIHAGLAGHLAALRHTDNFVICDSGLPIGSHTPCVDLGYRYGAPGFADIVAVVLPELFVEASWISRDMQEHNPNCLDCLRQHGLEPTPIPHEEFKIRVLNARFVIRTGEATLYANVLCQAGPAF